MATNALAPRGGKRDAPNVPATVGRPTIYKPEYCGVIEHLAETHGYSPAQLATVLRVDKGTLYKWAGEHEEFNHSLARAKTYEQAFWETTGRKALNRKHFQSQVWRTSMAARFKDDYTESRSGVEVTLNLGEMVAASISPAKDITPGDVTLAPPDKPKL